MTIRIFLAAILLAALNGLAWAADCAGLRKELNSLRLEYKEYASKVDKTGVTFDGLAEILDKIVKVKSEMSKLPKCTVPPLK
jgi:hypothetical protein